MHFIIRRVYINLDDVNDQFYMFNLKQLQLTISIYGLEGKNQISHVHSWEGYRGKLLNIDYIVSVLVPFCKLTWKRSTYRNLTNKVLEEGTIETGTYNNYM